MFNWLWKWLPKSDADLVDQIEALEDLLAEANGNLDSLERSHTYLVVTYQDDLQRYYNTIKALVLMSGGEAKISLAMQEAARSPEALLKVDTDKSGTLTIQVVEVPMQGQTKND